MPLENHVTMVNNRNAVELVQLGQIMDNAKKRLVLFLNQVAKKTEDVILRCWIQAGCHLITDHAGRVIGQLKAQPQPPQLSTT